MDRAAEMLPMENAEILRRRLHHQGITRPGWRSPAAVVEAFGAMQAQEFAMACWAIGLRCPGSNEKAVVDAFNAGEILRTHVLRPTWHFVSPTDLRWMLALSSPRVHALNAYQYRELGLDPGRRRRSADLMAGALGAGQPLTRDELQAALARAGIKLTGPALAGAVMHAELEGLICSGPRVGRRFTYALIEQRVPAFPPVSREEALIRLAQKYFRTRGPATLHDFAHWSSLTLRDVRLAAQGLGKGFAAETRDGRTLLFPQRASSAGKQSPGTFLQPDYDEYGVSYRDRSALFDHPKAPIGKLAFNRVIIVDGRVAGSWRRTLAGNRVRLELQLARSLAPHEQRAVDEAVARYSQFIGRSHQPD
ncbi:MAG TPA: winged helix DNA-binding domain-containing protein [Lacunisphaera sp.]|nr:winged helix DNA-binding domain-containing protein [Lacunisphaera sp.]